jgi:peptidyl-tRNA hydrolase
VQDHTQADRLYIISRRDLPIGLSAAQSAHAAFEFSRRFPAITGRWMAESNFIVLVTVEDEAALHALFATALGLGLKADMNYEPDLDDEATALVLQPGPQARRLCSHLPLLGKEVAVAA